MRIDGPLPGRPSRAPSPAAPGDGRRRPSPLMGGAGALAGGTAPKRRLIWWRPPGNPQGVGGGDFGLHSRCFMAAGGATVHFPPPRPGNHGQEKRQISSCGLARRWPRGHRHRGEGSQPTKCKSSCAIELQPVCFVLCSVVPKTRRVRSHNPEQRHVLGLESRPPSAMTKSQKTALASYPPSLRGNNSRSAPSTPAKSSLDLTSRSCSSAERHGATFPQIRRRMQLKATATDRSLGLLAGTPPPCLAGPPPPSAAPLLSQPAFHFGGSSKRAAAAFRPAVSGR